MRFRALPRWALSGALLAVSLAVTPSEDLRPAWAHGPGGGERRSSTTPTTRAAEAVLRPKFQPTSYADGRARPRSLAFNAADGLLYVGLSTADAVAVIEPGVAPRVRALVPVCSFPDALVALPRGGVLVSCRFEPALRRLEQQDAGSWRVSALAASATSGARGLALSADAAFVYVASPPSGGVQVLALPEGKLVQTLPTGLGPRALAWVAGGTLPDQTSPLLLVSNFISHTVTVHAVGEDGQLTPALQTISTAAPVLALGLLPETRELWLLTHEDRALSRANGPVEGLDSGVLRLPFARGPRGAANSFFDDLGPERRAFANFSEREGEPVVELAALARGAAHVAVVGAGSDNLWLGTAASFATKGGRPTGVVATVGLHPSDVVALPGDRFVTADRLSDTLTFVGAGNGRTPAVETTLSLGGASSPAKTLSPELRRRIQDGERLFFSTALVPHNVADGSLSLYTCAACHDDARIDGRRHPSKKNRFFSMTKTCVGLATTPPFLSLGEPETLEGFADNIVATHAQGAERDPAHFDVYPVELRERAGDRWRTRHLGPEDVRAALAAYMASIPAAPSPFVPPGRDSLTPVQRRGLALFADGCAGCHQLVGSTAHANVVGAGEREARLLAGQVALTSAERYDVGTPVLGKGGNNPPSLRGVWEAAPYFSDGSAETLDQVLARTNPKAPRVHAAENAAPSPAYDDEARAALRAFLLTL